MIINIKIDIKGAKESEFKNDNKEVIKFYHAYDEKENRYKINEEIYKGLISGNLPSDIMLAPDSKLITSDKGIISIK